MDVINGLREGLAKWGKGRDDGRKGKRQGEGKYLVRMAHTFKPVLTDALV